MTLDDESEVWRLPIAGFEVVDVWFSVALYVIAYGDEFDAERREAARTQIALQGAFRFTSADGHLHDLDGRADWPSLTPVLALRHSRITSATADRVGRLRIGFDNSARLEADWDEQYENWELDGPGRLNLVAPPGGGDPRISV